MIEMMLEILDSSQTLSGLSDRLQPAMNAAFEKAGDQGRRFKDALHGTWLGHPLHPVLVDVPIGAWTAAVFLDAAAIVSGRKKLRSAADACIALGLVGAVGSAITGWTDWSRVGGRGRQIGVVHAVLNISATALFAAALTLRRARHRKTGGAATLLGYGLALAGAYLGGDLVFDKTFGVNHAADGRELSQDFVPVMAAADLPEGELRRACADGAPIVLVRRGETIVALYEKCSHLGGPLADGKIEGDCIRCPWHGSCFALDDGRVVEGPATFSQPFYETRVKDGQVEIRRV